MRAVLSGVSSFGTNTMHEGIKKVLKE